ncbi:MAG: NUDIX domain-containing protein [Candidatus Heimdallarchaeaceae archaeon]
MKSNIFSKFTVHRIGVGGVCICKNKILLTQHSHGYNKDQWRVPGGFVEFGESLSHAIQREVMEETGIKVQAKSIIGIRHLVRERELGGLVSDLYVIFKSDYLEGEPQIKDKSEIKKVEFVSINEAKRRNITELTRYILEKIVHQVEVEFLPKNLKISSKKRKNIHSYEFYG